MRTYKATYRRHVVLILAILLACLPLVGQNAVVDPGQADPAGVKSLNSSAPLANRAAGPFKDIPRDYLIEPDNIPEFWLSTVEGVNKFLDERVTKGAVRTIGTTAGGRPIRAVFYGHPRARGGTTTFSGALGFVDVRAYLGPDYEKKVFLALSGVHGGELEGIVGAVNFLAVLETGRDLRGKPWPEIVSAARALDRIIVLPVLNVDGRVRIPLRMMGHSDKKEMALNDYFNTGAWRDGSRIGWPGCKEFIPLDFSRTQFPGGYPNDNGVNLQHDDFFGSRRQPETQALFDLTELERPDLILNMHAGGAPFMRANRSFIEPVLMPVFEQFYRRVQTRLTVEKLQGSDDPALESDPASMPLSSFNLDTALNLHCGALTVIFEAPSHTFSVKNRKGETVIHKPDGILDAELVTRQETMKFLAESGGRFRWTQKRSK